METQWLGLQKYGNIERYQKEMVPDLKGSERLLILGMEFEPVITMGIRADVSADFTARHEDLVREGFEIVKTDRGGQATLHSPGQLVIYPMVDLRSWNWGIKKFVSLLMQVTIRTLGVHGIEAQYDPSFPGIYTNRGKIAFCGLKVDQGVVRHGISINICNNLGYFGNIRSCGRIKASLDRVHNYSQPELAEFFVDWITEFRKDFPLSASQSVDMNM